MLKTGVYTQLSPVLFGNGTIAMAGEQAKAMGITKAMIVTDKGLVAVGHDKKVIASLEAVGIPWVLWPNAISDCPDSSVRDGAAVAREEKVDGIIGIGGGSSLDTAKSIASIAANTDDILDEIPAYLMGIKGGLNPPPGSKFYQNPPFPKILIPTTSGTGSESTFMAVITDSKLDCKIGLPAPPPAYAIVDPELTLGMPTAITAFTGMDAFSHANESLTEQKSTHHSDLLSYDVIRIVTEWLPKACADPQDLEAREWMATASNLAGIAFNESGVHIGHSIAHALGHKYHLAHGICCALTTPPTIEFVAVHYPEKTKKIGEAMGMTITETDPVKLGKLVADNVRALMREVGIQSFNDLGITREDVLSMEDLVYGEPLCICFDGTVTREEVVRVLESCCDNYK